MASDENYVKLVSKYNLEVGYTCTSNSKASCTWMEEQSGIQKDTMIGKLATDKYPIYGTINFSNYNYWGNVEEYKYSYNSECLLYRYIEQYKEYLEFEGLRIEEARLISVDELFELGCTVNNCDAAPSWVIGTTYWTGGARSGGNDNVWVVENRIVYQFGSNHYTSIFTAGIRPVIVLAKNKL